MPKKSSEDEKTQYSCLDPLEHVLLRPGMYIGSIIPSKKEFYSVDSMKIVKKEGLINEGLHRIFLEILNNAIDNVWRSSTSSTPVTKIKVNIEKETGIVTIFNDGKTIPIEINQETGLYNPEMLFGKLMSGSNFDDSQERKTSGTNGVGSSVCNIFSKSFEVEIFDNHTKNKYVQSWTTNMKHVTKAKITSPKTKTGYVQIKFTPDYQRFGCDNLSDEMF